MGESRAEGKGWAYGASADHRYGLMVKPEHLDLTKGLHLRMECGTKEKTKVEFKLIQPAKWQVGICTQVCKFPAPLLTAVLCWDWLLLLTVPSERQAHR